MSKLVKCVCVVFCLFFMAQQAQAQKEVTKKVADSCCKCLESKRSQIKTKEDMDMAGQSCIIKYMFPNLDTLAKENKIESAGLETQTQKIGESVGMYMALNCPYILELINTYSEDKKVPMMNDEEEGMDVYGTVTNVEMGEFVHISVKDQKGKISKLTMLRHFEGAETYMSSPVKLKGKKKQFYYRKAKIYSPKQKKFISILEITDLYNDDEKIKDPEEIINISDKRSN